MSLKSLRLVSRESEIRSWETQLAMTQSSSLTLGIVCTMASLFSVHPIDSALPFAVKASDAGICQASHTWAQYTPMIVSLISLKDTVDVDEWYPPLDTPICSQLVGV